MTKPRIAIVGAGSLGTALALALSRAGYKIEVVIAHGRGASFNRAEKLAAPVGARASIGFPKKILAEVIWFCVPDGQIALAAREFAGKIQWKNRVVFHSSGALASDELDALRRLGASVGSVHPMMTFVAGSRPPLAGVPFAVEGDVAAVRVARRIVENLGGTTHTIRKKDKVAYHAWGAFASPLFTALVATAEQVARIAGIAAKDARRRMIPILLQTLANYASFGAAEAFSGPIIRGDVDTVKRHLRALRGSPPAREVYQALGKAALRYLPVKRKADLQRALRS